MVGSIGFSDGYRNLFDFYGPRDEKYCDFHDEKASDNQSYIIIQFEDIFPKKVIRSLNHSAWVDIKSQLFCLTTILYYLSHI